MLRHGHALGLQGVKRPDDLELKGCADPHSVGIHQFLDHVGAWSLATTDSLNRVNLGIPRLLQLLHKGFGGVQSKEVGRLVLRVPARCLVQVIQAGISDRTFAPRGSYTL